jgi:hypothetical protein
LQQLVPLSEQQPDQSALRSAPPKKKDIQGFPVSLVEEVLSLVFVDRLQQFGMSVRSRRKAGNTKEEETAIADVETKEAVDGTEAEEAADTLQAGGGKTGGPHRHHSTYHKTGGGMMGVCAMVYRMVCDGKTGYMVYGMVCAMVYCVLAWWQYRYQ